MGSPCFRAFVRYSSLNMLGMLALSCYVLADTFFVANALGADGLAALNLALPVYAFFHGCGLMVGMGGATRYTILREQGRGEQANAVFTHALAMVCVLAVFFTSLGLFGADFLTRILGADAVTWPMTRVYIQVLLLFSPAYLLNDLLIAFVRNDGAPHLSMLGMTAGSLSNIVLDYVFIYIMDWGMFGAVFATGLAPIISLSVLSPFFLQKRNRFHPVRCTPAPHLCASICATGVPALVAEVSAGFVMIVFNVILLDLGGNLAVAAYGVVANLSMVVFAIFSGLAQGVQPLLSRYYGGGDLPSIRATLRYAVGTVLLLSALLYAFLFLGADPIAMAFNEARDPALQAIAVRGLKLYFTGLTFTGLNLLLTNYFPAVGHPRPSHLISVLRGFLLILPLVFLLARLWGMDGLWLANPLTELLVAGLALFLYLRQRSALL